MSGSRTVSPKLLGLLVRGDLPAFAGDKKGDVDVLSPTYFVGKQLSLIGTVGNNRNGQSAGRPLVRKADLHAKVPTVAAFAKSQREAALKTQPVPTETASGANKGGHPTVYSEADFMIEAFRLIWFSNMPSSEAKFREMALDAFYKKNGKLPSDAWARPRIRKIVQELEITFGSAATT